MLKNKNIKYILHEYYFMIHFITYLLLFYCILYFSFWRISIWAGGLYWRFICFAIRTPPLSNTLPCFFDIISLKISPNSSLPFCTPLGLHVQKLLLLTLQNSCIPWDCCKTMVPDILSCPVHSYVNLVPLCVPKNRFKYALSI